MFLFPLGNIFPWAVKKFVSLEERVTNDLLIVFVRNLDGQDTISYPYGFPEGKSVVIIDSTSFLETYDIAHEIGHVLGAGHTPDPECKFFIVHFDQFYPFFQFVRFVTFFPF